MPGMLYLCATPIGNLGDMTPRAVEILKEADVIAAEDTRNSIHLLTHFDIHTPMTSYHEYNKVEKAEQLVGSMLAGKNVAGRRETIVLPPGNRSFSVRPHTTAPPAPQARGHRRRNWLHWRHQHHFRPHPATARIATAL